MYRFGQDDQGDGDDDKQDTYRQVRGERFAENQYPDTYGGDRFHGPQYSGKRPADTPYGKYEGDIRDDGRNDRQQDQVGKGHPVGNRLYALIGSGLDGK